MRLTLVGVLAATLLVATGASAAAPTAPLGLDLDGKEFALVSNSLWTVKGADARDVQILAHARKGGTSARDRQELAYIWASKCTAAKQEIVFKRSLFMPGPPVEFGATFSDTTFTSAPADRAIGGVKLFINGRHALSFKGASATLARTDEFEDYFKFGINTFEIHVIKRAEQKAKGIGLCRNSGKPLGLTFVLEGAFEADLWLADDGSKTEEDYVKGTPGATEVEEIGVDPRNLGPSGAYKGTLTLHISASGVKAMTVQSVDKKGPEIEDCKVSPDSVTGQSRVDCAIDRFPAKAPASVTANVQVTFLPTFSTAFVFVSAEIHSPTDDPVLSDNGWRSIRYFCGPTANNPKCPK